ncbi:MAG: flagellar biosynthesis anti-sigma factor FlgM [Gammaproteobacteria bacterium]|nr:flagellar biosynthesis anti-sigma factor FlgM [Gammaproteobacteria bacterium]MDP2139348.1 flagellar biosynthesis anti-sigma factor FlgM [Gammaproteobacteria bacterium]MDP2347263.1 flagellar biosynthesis anti-sigma factor FlgM [Gammaproteobacteria bacterium]
MTVSTIGSNATPTPSEHRSAGTSGTSPVSINSASANRAAVSGSSDTVHISSQAIDLQGLEAHINQLPDVDKARVAELRTQIANGQYQINYDKVAEKILGLESEL